MRYLEIKPSPRFAQCVECFWTLESDQRAEQGQSEPSEAVQPEVHLRGDRNVRYEYVGRVILMLQKGGIQKVGFISEPDRGIR